MNALFVAVSIAAYVFIGGGLGYGFQVWRKKVCGCSHRICNDHEIPAAFAGAFWPVVVLVLCGFVVAKFVVDREWF